VAVPTSDEGRGAVERAIETLIATLGLDPGAEPELRRTPSRIAAFYAEIFAGLDPANAPDLATFPHPESEGERIVVRNLPFHSLCIHHFVPFFGRAHIAYAPAGTIVGISGPARVLDHYARRPQLQERLTRQVADHLERVLRPRGLAVRIEARHLCMEMRGIRRYGMVETEVARGTLSGFGWTPASGGSGPR
jgi:GTP cyclohydrolase IA